MSLLSLVCTSSPDLVQSARREGNKMLHQYLNTIIEMCTTVINKLPESTLPYTLGTEPVMWGIRILTVY